MAEFFPTNYLRPLWFYYFKIMFTSPLLMVKRKHIMRITNIDGFEKIHLEGVKGIAEESQKEKQDRGIPRGF